MRNIIAIVAVIALLAGGAISAQASQDDYVWLGQPTVSSDSTECSCKCNDKTDEKSDDKSGKTATPRALQNF